MRCWLASSRRASRTVLRLTPERTHSCGSVGSRSPGRNCPDVICSRRSSASNWYAGARPGSMLTVVQPRASRQLSDVECRARCRCQQQARRGGGGDDRRYAGPGRAADDHVVPDRHEQQLQHDRWAARPGPGTGEGDGEPPEEHGERGREDHDADGAAGTGRLVRQAVVGEQDGDRPDAQGLDEQQGDSQPQRGRKGTHRLSLRAAGTVPAMRALLVVNHKATTTSGRVRDVLVQALRSVVDLSVEHTRERRHAAGLARQAAADGMDVVVVLGGDGTVNEAVNGLLAHGVPASGPAFAVVPGGSTNVFARALGLPADWVEATGVLLEALREGRYRTIGLGRADERYFTFCAGFGLDAEVIARVEPAGHADRTAGVCCGYTTWPSSASGRRSRSLSSSTGITLASARRYASRRYPALFVSSASFVS